jgi:demethylmenaquinone methyltransferase/2-methoxy-6-polyprenyl-1,4-benzoquinol methylase
MDHSISRRNYDRLSRWYDLLESSWERKPREATLASLEAAPGDMILEIGCGTGNSLADLSNKTTDSGCIVGIDLSTGMLRQTRQRLLREKSSPRIFLTQADAVLLPFEDNVFDIIFLSFTLELFINSEIPIVLAECFRVLKPGAKLGVVFISNSGGRRWMTSIYSFLHRAFPHLVDCSPINLLPFLKTASLYPRDQRLFSLFGIGVESIIADKP